MSGCIYKIHLEVRPTVVPRFYIPWSRPLKSGLFSRIAAAPMESGRSVTKEQLDNIWKGRAELHDSPEEAFATLIGARGEKDMVYAAGSLYLAGQLLACGKND